jgi:hypothetical protein
MASIFLTVSLLNKLSQFFFCCDHTQPFSTQVLDNVPCRACSSLLQMSAAAASAAATSPAPEGKRPHALVLGGSGMLKGVVAQLVSSTAPPDVPNPNGVPLTGYAVSVICRDKSRLSDLGPHAHALSLDYSDRAALTAALSAAVRERGRFSLAVCWIHMEKGPAVAFIVSQFVDGDLFHVLGSASIVVPVDRTLRPAFQCPPPSTTAPSVVADKTVAADAKAPAVAAAARPPVKWPADVPCALSRSFAYREIGLGFIVDGRSSRWLKWEEIAAGVLTAIAKRAERFVIGTVEPWELRPRY